MKMCFLIVPAAACAIAVGCSSGDDAPTGCAGLAACCTTLTGTEAESCTGAVASSGGSDSACQVALSGLESVGQCGGTAGGDATGCAALAACCDPDGAYEGGSTEDDASSCLVMGQEAPCVDP
jgi:hypothetical protein